MESHDARGAGESSRKAAARAETEDRTPAQSVQQPHSSGTPAVAQPVPDVQPVASREAESGQAPVPPVWGAAAGAPANGPPGIPESSRHARRGSPRAHEQRRIPQQVR